MREGKTTLYKEESENTRIVKKLNEVVGNKKCEALRRIKKIIRKLVREKH